MINYIKFEIDMMGDLADYKLPMIATNPTCRKMMEFGIEFLEGSNPCIGDVCYYIIKLKDVLNHSLQWECPPQFKKKAFETVLRLIELVWRIEKEWKLLDIPRNNLTLH